MVPLDLVGDNAGVFGDVIFVRVPSHHIVVGRDVVFTLYAPAVTDFDHATVYVILLEIIDRQTRTSCVWVIFHERFRRTHAAMTCRMWTIEISARGSFVG